MSQDERDQMRRQDSAVLNTLVSSLNLMGEQAVIQHQDLIESHRRKQAAEATSEPGSSTSPWRWIPEPGCWAGRGQSDDCTIHKDIEVLAKFL